MYYNFNTFRPFHLLLREAPPLFTSSGPNLGLRTYTRQKKVGMGQKKNPMLEGFRLLVVLLKYHQIHPHFIPQHLAELEKKFKKVHLFVIFDDSFPRARLTPGGSRSVVKLAICVTKNLIYSGMFLTVFFYLDNRQYLEFWVKKKNSDALSVI